MPSAVPKSIAFLINTLTHGGAEMQVARLALTLRRRGWNATVISMTDPTALVDDLRAGGVDYAGLGMKAGVPNPLAVFSLRKLLRRLRPTILHSHIVHANILARVARMISPIPVLVCTAHNTNEGGRARELAYRITDGLADLTTNVSQASVDRYIAVKAAPAHRIRFVPNGLDTQLFKPDPDMRAAARAELKLDGRFVWLAIGRLEEAKDYPTLIRAFSKLAAGPGEPEPALLIAGKGHLRGELEALVQSLGQQQRVRFLGVRSDVARLMNAADAYVMSSAWEGMPLVLQEASAVGLPIIATNVGGNGEVVLAGKSGELTPSGSPEDLATSMRRIMSLSGCERSAMGAAGRAHVRETFDIERIVDVWESIYGELLAKRGMAVST